MSAWIVEDGHIDVLVNALVQFGVVPRNLGAAGYREIGQTLWHENHRSVNHHYRESTPTPGYQLRTTEADLDPIRVLRTINCYQYQSCEHPDWADSDAHKLTNRLRDTLLQRHPQYAQKVPTPLGERHLYTTLPEYRQAPWGIESLDEALSTHRPPAAQTAVPE